MKTRGVYVINPFDNPNKTTAYRVAGTTLNGVRIRENYKTQPEALARKQQLEIEALNFTPEKRITTTRLTPAQEAEAERLRRTQWPPHDAGHPLFHGQLPRAAEKNHRR